MWGHTFSGTPGLVRLVRAASNHQDPSCNEDLPAQDAVLQGTRVGNAGITAVQ